MPFCHLLVNVLLNVNVFKVGLILILLLKTYASNVVEKTLKFYAKNANELREKYGSIGRIRSFIA